MIPYAASAAGLAALLTVVSTVVSARWLPANWPLLHGAFALAPFLLLGLTLPLLLSARPSLTGSIYGADLIGAGAGARSARCETATDERNQPDLAAAIRESHCDASQPTANLTSGLP